ncbi:hypothetical protein REPUB_Repub03eG0049200 [Reevesia pubescens]
MENSATVDIYPLVEETDELVRSRRRLNGCIEQGLTSKKESAIKAGHNSLVFYKDCILSGNYGSFSVTISNPDRMEEEHLEDEKLLNGDCMDEELVVKLSLEERMRFRQRWANALIVKVYGRTVGYRFLVHKLEHLWTSIIKPTMVDLGRDFYLLNFHNDENLNYVLPHGPWFINGHFLTMRKWEPNFRASETSFSSVAIWIRLLELPVEYFDAEILKKIGKCIGKLIRVDGHTLVRERERYARICVQISLEKHLPIYVKMEGRRQALVYESIGMLCFHYGKGGAGEGLGPWMVVQRRKPNKKTDSKYPRGNDFGQKLKSKDPIGPISFAQNPHPPLMPTATQENTIDSRASYSSGLLWTKKIGLLLTSLIAFPLLEISMWLAYIGLPWMSQVVASNLNNVEGLKSVDESGLGQAILEKVDTHKLHGEKGSDKTAVLPLFE